MHSFSRAHCLAARRGRRSCLALDGSASGSGLRSPYASSPMHQAVSCSTLLYLWTGSSSPVASHPAFRRRSFLRLRTASVLSDGDFHPTVGAHSQAHVERIPIRTGRCISTQSDHRSFIEAGLSTYARAVCVAKEPGRSLVFANGPRFSCKKEAQSTI